MSNENITQFINAVIRGDKDAAKAALSPVVISNARQILGHEVPQPVQAVTESHEVKMLREMFEDHESPIRLKGDKVLVNGKEVGMIQTDYEDFDSGINFIESDGRFSKEFADAEQLFRFLLDRYNGNQQGV